MASACINDPYASYGRLSPRISLSPKENKILNPSSPNKKLVLGVSSHQLHSSTSVEDDFEFRLPDNVAMLSADELFPLQFFPAQSASPPPSTPPEKTNEDPFLFSPKAPRCSGRWRELLGLRKLNQINSQPKKTSSAASSTSSSMKLLLNQNSKTASSSVDPSLSLPLLKESSSSSSLEYESISISSSSRLSLSSSSSGHDHEELPRLSLGVEKPNRPLSSGPKVRTALPRMENTRVGRSPIEKEKTTVVMTRGLSVDSPRLNPSGKVVFQSLERSSSSPSSFNGGPRYNRGMMERSDSANVHVRIAPVLNVPVCSLRGSSKSCIFRLDQLFSSSSSTSSQPLKKEGCTRSYCHYPHTSSRNKKEKEKK